MGSDPGSITREKLVAAAELLMAEHGVDGVDLSAIRVAAGQRNRSVIAYHFGGREGLVAAIAEKHRPRVNEVCNRLLDRVTDTSTIEAVVAALVEPVVASLETPSGRAFIIISAELAGRIGSSGLNAPDLPRTEGIGRAAALLRERVSGSDAVRRRLVGQALVTVPVLMADIARDIDRGVLTVAQGKRRAATVTTFVAAALGGDGARGVRSV